MSYGRGCEAEWLPVDGETDTTGGLIPTDHECRRPYGHTGPHWCCDNPGGTKEQEQE